MAMDMYQPPPIQVLLCRKCDAEMGERQNETWPIAYVAWQKERREKKRSTRQRKRKTNQWQRMVNLNKIILCINALMMGKVQAVAMQEAVHWSCATEPQRAVWKNLVRGAGDEWFCESAGPHLLRLLKSGIHPYAPKMGSNLVPKEMVKSQLIALPDVSLHAGVFTDFLPPSIAAMYMNENNFLTKDKGRWEKAKNFDLKPFMSEKVYVEILVRMFDVKMITFLDVGKVEIRNGVQAVWKSDGAQRLIIDGRPANVVLEDPPKSWLPHPMMNERLLLNNNEVLRCCKLDLDNYYHRLRVPIWMHTILGMPDVKTQLLPAWVVEAANISTMDKVTPVVLSLPMGLSHSVYIAQEVHLHMIRSNPRLDLEPNGVIGCHDSVVSNVYIDDHFVLQRAEKEEKLKSNIRGIAQELKSTYERNRLPAKESKCVEDEGTIQALGMIIDGEKGEIRPVEEKLILLCRATRQFIMLSTCRRKDLEKLVGFWVWNLLVLRPAFSVLHNVYRLLKEEPDALGEVPLWQSVKFEFFLLTNLAGFLRAQCRRKIATKVFASDASETGGGIVSTTWSKETVCKYIACSSEISSDDFDNVQWDVEDQRRWEEGGHISHLEAKEFGILMYKLGTQTELFSQRVVICLDSQAVCFAAKKGRSSVYPLLVQLRKVLAHSLISNTRFYYVWIPSAWNRADAPSRM